MYTRQTKQLCLSLKLFSQLLFDMFYLPVIFPHVAAYIVYRHRGYLINVGSSGNRRSCKRGIFRHGKHTVKCMARMCALGSVRGSCGGSDPSGCCVRH